MVKYKIWWRIRHYRNTNTHLIWSPATITISWLIIPIVKSDQDPFLSYSDDSDGPCRAHSILAVCRAPSPAGCWYCVNDVQSHILFIVMYGILLLWWQAWISCEVWALPICHQADFWWWARLAAQVKREHFPQLSNGILWQFILFEKMVTS